jgi:3-oxoacyl-[acyl-carrier protein] reductase
VTGAESGIGHSIAVALARAGCRVAVNYFRSADGAEAVAAELRTFGVDAITVQADVRVASEVTAMMQAAVDRFGRLDILVNNAGTQTFKPFLEVTEEEWDLVIDTNLKGSFLCTQAAARHMKPRGSGVVINIGSGCNKVPFPSLVAYTASKGGLEMLTKVSALELAPEIRVNCVAPGAIEVERTKLELVDYAGTFARMTPLRRVGYGDDVADAVVFLASDAARFITGQTLAVDGGLFSQPPLPPLGT